MTNTPEKPAPKGYVIQQADTAWSEADRAQGEVSLPPTQAGLRKVEAQITSLAVLGLTVVYCWNRDPGLATAKMLAEKLHLPCKESEYLRPLDLGFWTGLRWREIENRFSRMMRQWHANPGNYAPPDGETFTEARERVRPFLKKALSRKQVPLIVVSPELADALSHHAVSGENPWQARPLAVF